MKYSLVSGCCFRENSPTGTELHLCCWCCYYYWHLSLTKILSPVAFIEICKWNEIFCISDLKKKKVWNYLFLFLISAALLLRQGSHSVRGPTPPLNESHLTLCICASTWEAHLSSCFVHAHNPPLPHSLCRIKKTLWLFIVTWILQMYRAQRLMVAMLVEQSRWYH